MSQTTVGNLSVELGISDDQLRAGLAAAVMQAQQAGQKMQAGLNQATSRTGSSLGGFSMAFSRAIDDAQYGFRGVINNLEQIGMMGGQAFGLATPQAMALGAAVTLLGVAAYNASGYLEQLTDGRTEMQMLSSSALAFAGSLNMIETQLKQLSDETSKLLKEDNTRGLGAWLQRQIHELEKMQPEVDSMVKRVADSFGKITTFTEVGRIGIETPEMPGIDDAISRINDLSDAFSAMVKHVNQMALSLVEGIGDTFTKGSGLQINLPQMFPEFDARMNDEFKGLSDLNNVAVKYAKEIEQYLAESITLGEMPDLKSAIQGYAGALHDVILTTIAPLTEYLNGRVSEMATDAQGMVEKLVSPISWFFENFGKSIENQIELNKNAGRQAMRNQLDLLDMAPQAAREKSALTEGSNLIERDNNAKFVNTTEDASKVIAEAFKGNAAKIYGDLQMQLMNEGVQGNEAEVKARTLIGYASKGVTSAFEELDKRLPGLGLASKLQNANNFKETDENMQRLADTFKDQQKKQKEIDSLTDRRENVQDRIDRIMNMRARSEIIGASDIFNRNISAGTEDPQLKELQGLREDIKKYTDEIKGLG